MVLGRCQRSIRGQHDEADWKSRTCGLSPLCCKRRCHSSERELMLPKLAANTSDVSYTASAHSEHSMAVCMRAGVPEQVLQAHLKLPVFLRITENQGAKEGGGHIRVRSRYPHSRKHCVLHETSIYCGRDQQVPHSRHSARRYRFQGHPFVVNRVTLGQPYCIRRGSECLAKR